MGAELAGRDLIIIMPLAGSGTRLFPLTKDLPKPMVPLAGKTILEHVVAKIGEITDDSKQYCFILGHKHAILREFITEIMPSDSTLHFVVQKPFSAQLGTKERVSRKVYSGLGDAIALAEPWADAKDCLIILGDRLPTLPYSALIAEARVNNLDGAINVNYVDDPHHYGICELDTEEIITNIIEKPQQPPSNLAVAGAYFLRSSVTHSMFKKLQAQALRAFDGIHEHDFTRVLQHLIDEGAKLGVKIHPKSKPILDLGRPESLLYANEVLLTQEKRLVDCPVGLKISGNVYWKSPLTVKRTSLGPDVSIGTNCVLRDCTLRNAIIGDHVRLTGIEASDVICPRDTITSTFHERSLFVNSYDSPNPAPKPKKSG